MLAVGHNAFLAQSRNTLYDHSRNTLAAMFRLELKWL